MLGFSGIFPSISGVHRANAAKTASPRLITNPDRVTFSGTAPNHLAGKIAVVTGSTSGIGLAIAKKLAEEGASVVLHGLETQRQAQAAMAEVRPLLKAGAQVYYVRANLSNPAATEKFADRVLAKTGRVDVLVNNAGFQKVNTLADFSVSDFIALLNVHTVAPFILSKKFAASMEEKGWGRIVNIASAHGLEASDNKFGYVAGKHGVLGLTKSLAIHLAGKGITANAVCPGFVGTPLAEAQVANISDTEGVSPQVARDRLMHKQALKEFVSPDEVADLVDFLTRDAARSMNGAILSQDNGWMAGGS